MSNISVIRSQSYNIYSISQTHEEPVLAYDCEAQEEVLIILGIHQLPADNPMQSYLWSHIGLKGNCYCRKWDVGGTQDYKRTDKGYTELFFILDL